MYVDTHIHITFHIVITSFSFGTKGTTITTANAVSFRKSENNIQITI